MNDRKDYFLIRNGSYTRKEIARIESHNERLKEHYTNCDVVLERSNENVYFKRCEGSYLEAFDAREHAGIFSTRGLRGDAILMDEFLVDVNSEYFLCHGEEYTYAFFEDVYKCCVKKVGGEQNIISAVMHADERNVALSEKYGFDVWHYHLHVVYVPVVPKEIKYTKRWRDKAMWGKVRSTIMQVSHSKKWTSEPLRDKQGQICRDSSGGILYDYSYSMLQTEFFQHMQSQGYTDIARGEIGSKRKRRETVDFKLEQDEQRAKETVQKVNRLAIEADLRRNELKNISAECIYAQQALVESKEELSEIKDATEYFNQAAKCQEVMQEIFDRISYLINNRGVFWSKERERLQIEGIYDSLCQFAGHMRQLWGYEYREAVLTEERESIKITTSLAEKIAEAEAEKTYAPSSALHENRSR